MLSERSEKSERSERSEKSERSERSENLRDLRYQINLILKVRAFVTEKEFKALVAVLYYFLISSTYGYVP